MSEQWCAIPGFDGSYEVSDQGQVRSLDRVIERAGRPARQPGRVLRQGWSRGGYPIVILSLAGVHTTARVHRLVAEAFVPGRGPDLEVCHGDGNPKNNVASNLRWDTKSSNSLDAVAHGVHPSIRRRASPS